LRKRRKTNFGRSDLKGREWLHNVATILTLGFVEIKLGVKKNKR
jgi:hypothetical protein